jgi:hypothetical protein
VRNRGVGALQRHVPRLALLAGASRQRDFEVEAVHVPGVARRVGANLEVVGLEEILGGGVVAMFFLDSAE